VTFALPKDTGPLERDLVTGPQIALISNVNACLRSMRDDAQRSHTMPSVFNRTPRTLFITGESGSGKTSLMLTMIRHWASPSSWREMAPNTRLAGPADALFEGMDGVVQALPVMSLLSQPPNLNAYAWLVLSFLPLVERLSSDTWGEPSLWDLWNKLYRDTVLAWEQDTHDNQTSDTRVKNARVRQGGWDRIQDQWFAFMASLLKQLGHQRLLVVPIDDLGLNLDVGGDILRAVRWFWHPSVVFLLAGNLEDLVETVALEDMGKRRRLSMSSERSNDWAGSQRRASALIARVLPKSLRFTASKRGWYLGI